MKFSETSSRSKPEVGFTLIEHNKISLKQHGLLLGRRKLVLVGFMFSILIVLAIGLGVGLSAHHPNNDQQNTSSPGSSSTITSTITSNETTSAQIWQPQPGVTWNYQIDGALNMISIGSFDIWDIDLFDNNQSTVASIHSIGAKVVCYFSAGSYEDWRPDASNFSNSDFGNDLVGWAGEKWLNVASQGVRNIMLERLDLAVEKSCDGVDPDNMDGYNNDNGLGLTQQDAIDYVQFLASAAHARNLSIGLKNAGAIINETINVVQYSVNEQCAKYSECELYAAFVQQDKPVLHVEYPKGASTSNNQNVSSSAKTAACDAEGASEFSTIIKNINLDHWIETC